MHLPTEARLTDPPGRVFQAGWWRRCFLLAPLSSLLSVGCLGLPSWNPFKAPEAPPGPVDSMVLRGDQLEKDRGVVAKKGKTAADLDGAKELFRQADYVKAEKIFHRIAQDTKNSTIIAEEARYYEAECLRMQRHYPKAADTYSKLLKDFSTGQYREQAQQRLFDIANYWLDDTRAIMKASHDQTESKFTWLLPTNYLHFERTKPLFDQEGWAVEKLEQIKLDLASPLADKALFYLGSIKFFRKDYREADQHFTELSRNLPNSPLAPQAIKMAIICKQLTTGGSDYDGRKTDEARQLIHAAARMPEFSNKEKEKEFLQRQLYSISQQQADKDFKIAHFYERTGHPGSAYFYYEIVRRRYPGTNYAEKASQRMAQIKGAMDKEKAKKPQLFNMPLPWKKSSETEAQPEIKKNAGPQPLVPGSPLLSSETIGSPKPLPPELGGSR